MVWSIFSWDFWNSKTDANENQHRRIYIGEVPEIDDETEERRRSERSEGTEPEEEGNSTDAEVDLSKMAPLQAGGTVPNSMAKRRNSIGAGKTPPDLPPKLGKNDNFPSNQIVSSRYTWYTFLPKNILEQLRRVVNFYFVFMCFIQIFTESPVSPVTTATPLVFVMFVTAVKQGYEDWLRHSADNLVNNRSVNAIRSGVIVTIKAKDLVVGDVVKLEGEEQVPADILVIGSSDEFLRCQISTANLDGETNLKIRYCPGGVPSLKSEEDFLNLHAVIECDQPSPDLYEFTGSILIPISNLPQQRRQSQTSHSSKHRLIVPNQEKGVTGSKLKRTGNRSNVSSPIYSDPNSVSNFKSPTPSKDVPGYQSPNSPPLKSQSSLSFPPLPESQFLQIPISMENIALRGTRVKNTDFIYGLVIFTGKDTRLALNSKTTNTKFSTVEKSVNAFLILFIILLMILVLVCTACHFILRETDASAQPWYIPEPDINGIYIFNTVATFLVLFNYIIPISLYVTMELQKFFGSKFFVYDLDMRCPAGQLPLCNTSDLNEELGQIEYLFSDKTGTLTQNVMQFRFCSVAEKRFDLKEDDQLYLVDNEFGVNDLVDPEKSEELTKFLRTLALCHTVQLMPHRRPSFDISSGFTFRKQKITAKMRGASSLFTLESEGNHSIPGILANWEFQGSSPDEKALLEACCRMGVIYLGEKENVLTLDIFGKTETYKRHYVLEFDADRKCMSVIVEDSKGQIWLLCKGAESSVMSKSDAGPMKATLKHIVDFALMGMRTLAVAERKLTQNEFQDFSRKVKKARRMLKNREEKMREIYASMERNLTVLGATGVEDQLQEGVPETLQALSAAGIRVWMITGDKVETAVNVGISCGLVTAGTTQLFATGNTTPESTIANFQELSDKVEAGDNTTLIMDGQTLTFGLAHCPELVQYVTMGAYRVVACRMSPKAKSQVVSMVKSSSKKPITAAGDGANDVAMIQEAHIGIGIMGKEGRQAARCSDFALARFCFLRKAILVHGNWYYVRISKLAMYFFYKNLVFILPQVLFCIDSEFSGQSLFMGFFLTMYNIFFSSCPIFTYGLQEQPYSAKTLLSKPHLYKELTRNSCLTWKNFIIWHLLAVYHSLVIYYIPRYTWSQLHPEVNDLASFGTLIFCNVLAVTHVKIFEFIKFISGWTVFSFCYSVVTLIFFTGLYTELDLRPISSSFNTGDYHAIFFEVMGYANFWLIIICVTCLSLLPDFVGRCFINNGPAIQRVWRKMKKNFSCPKIPAHNAAVAPLPV